MERVFRKVLDSYLPNLNLYVYNESIWLISPSTKQWVLQLEPNNTLWYNFYFFENLLSYVSLDVKQCHKYIANYFTDVLNNKIKDGEVYGTKYGLTVEEIMECGTKRILPEKNNRHTYISRIIEEVRTPGDADIISTIEWMHVNKTGDVPTLIDNIINDAQIY
jgi:hypothetical protein